MVWVLFVVVAVLVIAATLGMLAGRIPFDRMSEPTHTTPALCLPADASPQDVENVRFDTALRGYRMDQVDEALAVLQARIEQLESKLAERDRRPQAAPQGFSKQGFSKQGFSEQGFSKQSSTDPRPEV